MENSKLVGPGQAHSAGGIVSDRLMEWGASRRCVQNWMDDENHPLWAEMKRHLVAIKTLKGMITAGNYKWVNRYYSEFNLPVPNPLVLGKGANLFRFGEIESPEGYRFRHATVWELLDFGIKNPEKQMEFDICALGEKVPCNLSGMIPYLGAMNRSDASSRKLDLVQDITPEHHDRYRVLGVLKETKL